MSENVLFELRVHEDENGTRIEVTTSTEWQEYHRARRQTRHAARRADRRGRGLLGWLMRCCGEELEPAEIHGDPRKRKRQPKADDLKSALDSLQGIYDDVYGDATP